MQGVHEQLGLAPRISRNGRFHEISSDQFANLHLLFRSETGILVGWGGFCADRLPVLAVVVLPDHKREHMVGNLRMDVAVIPEPAAVEGIAIEDGIIALSDYVVDGYNYDVPGWIPFGVEMSGKVTCESLHYDFPEIADDVRVDKAPDV